MPPPAGSPVSTSPDRRRRSRRIWRQRHDDQLRSADRQRRSPIALHPCEPPPARDIEPVDDEVRLALHIVMAQLTPAERIAFVLHDVLSYSFDAIGEILGRTPAACRQLASRARRRARR